MTNQKWAIEAHHLTKEFPGPPKSLVLKNISLQVPSGEALAIMGKSGSGKSTLLHILGTLETASSGTVSLQGQPLKHLPLAIWRRLHIGFVFQSFHLLEDYTVLDNVLMPARIAKQNASKTKGLSLLDKVGLADSAYKLAKHLSGGEKQRVALVRALCNDPELILADEPSGNLDKKTSETIHSLLLNLVETERKTLVIVTHDHDLAKLCHRTLILAEGELWTF